MAADFANLFLAAEQYRLLDALFPFLLIFTLVYAIFNKTHIIGEGKKNFNFVVSFIIAMMVVLPHLMGTYPEGQDVVLIINAVIPQVSLVLIGILSILILVGVFGNRLDIAGTSIAGWVALLAIVTVGLIFGQSLGWWEGFPPFLNFLNDPDTQALLLILGVFFLVIFYVTREDEGGASIGGGFGQMIAELGKTIKPK